MLRTFFIFILGSLICYSQENSELIKLEGHKGNYVVFNKNYKAPFYISNFEKSFTPTLKQIKSAENLLIEQYNSSKRNFIDSINKHTAEELKYPKKIKNVKRKLCKYKRQYVGYITKNNDTIIAISLLNFKKKKKANVYFADWKDRYIIGFDGFYDKNVEYFSANLNTEQLSLGNGK